MGWRGAWLAAWLAIATPALAADRLVGLVRPPPFGMDVAAMPLIADPVDEAERAVNAAVRRIDAAGRKAAAGCRTRGQAGDYSRVVEVPMSGPGYISYTITDSYYCGGAHPDFSTVAIVYDLRTGLPIDWTHVLPRSLTGTVALESGADGTRMVSLASRRLYELYLARYGDGDSRECADAIRQAGEYGPPAMQVWLDGGTGGLAARFSVYRAARACEGEVVIPVSVLRAEGAQPALLAAIEAAAVPHH